MAWGDLEHEQREGSGAREARRTRRRRPGASRSSRFASFAPLRVVRVPNVILAGFGDAGRHAPALALALYLLLTLAMTYPLVRQFASAIPGDSFDGWQNVWNLWWVRLALLERHASPYFTDLLYYPTGVSLLFHTLNPFNGLLTLPVQLAWGLIPAYNVAVIFSFAVGGLGAYLLARQALGRGRGARPAAFVAGCIFTFAPFHVAHLLGHLQMLALEWLPFYALYLWRIVGPRPRSARLRRDAALAALFLVLVGLCDWYYVLYCLILTALALLWAGWQGLAGNGVSLDHETHARSRQTLPATLRDLARRFASFAIQIACATPLLGVALVGLLSGLLLSPLLVPMLREASRSHFMVPDPTQSRTLSADLLAFVTPQEFHPLWGAWAAQQARFFTATVSEHQVFAGYGVLLLAGLGLWAGRRRAGGAAGVSATRARQVAIRQPASFWLPAALVFFMLALGPVLHIAGRTDLLPGGREIPLPYAWLAQAPFMNISRSVSRFDVMVMLALAVLAAFGIKWLLSWRRWGAGAGILALALVLFEFWPAPYPVSPPDTPAWYGALAVDARPGAVLNLPMNWDRPWYLLYQTVHHKPLAVAYISRDDPRTLTERAPVLQHFRHLGPDIVDFDLAAQGQQVLADLGVRWVVLDRYKMPGARERGYNEDTARLIFGGHAPVYQDQRLTVYEVGAAAHPAPYLILGDGWGPFADGARAFTGSATLTVQAPAAGRASLTVELAPGSAGLAVAPAGGDRVTLPLDLQAGANQVLLRSRQPAERVVVRRLALAAPPPAN